MREYKKGIWKLNSLEISEIDHLVSEFRHEIGLPYHKKTFANRMGAIMDSGQAHIFAAKKDGEIIAFLAMQISQELMSDLVFAIEMGWWVTPAHRGGMIAGRLFNAFESFADEQGVDHKTMIRLEGHSDSELDQFYKKKGYRPLEHQYIK